MGGLTSIDLSGNQLCGIYTYLRELRGTYTTEGIAAIAEALRVNGALTALDLSSNTSNTTSLPTIEALCPHVLRGQ